MRAGWEVRGLGEYDGAHRRLLASTYYSAPGQRQALIGPSLCRNDKWFGFECGGAGGERGWDERKVKKALFSTRTRAHLEGGGGGGPDAGASEPAAVSAQPRRLEKS